jgi:glycosyltransferase involved in cell wall biosynthesis
VATRVGGVEEVLDPDAGVLVPPRDPEALAGAIRESLERSPPDAATLAARARERFGYEALGRTWDEIYAELSSSAGSSSWRTTRASSSRR